MLELVRLRAQLEFERSEAERAAHWAHVVDVDEGITEVDEEIAATGYTWPPDARVADTEISEDPLQLGGVTTPPGLPRRQASCGSRTTSYSPARSARHSKPRNVNRAFYGMRADAGLPWLRLHDLRHAFATFLIDQGEELRTVNGSLLGHSTIRRHS